MSGGERAGEHGAGSAVVSDVEVGRYYDAYQAYLVADLPEDGRRHCRDAYLAGVRGSPAARWQIRRILDRPGVEEAAALAYAAHFGQRDKAGKPYVDHVLAVGRSLRAYGDRAVMAGFLHDVVEDTAVTLELLVELGYPGSVVRAVDSVTRRVGESYGELIDRAAADPVGAVGEVG